MLHTHIHSFGFDGILYPADSRRDKVVIVVSGSNGGMKMAADCAAFYSANGIPALAVAIFKTEYSEKNLDRIPVEYIDNSIRWLKKNGYERIAIDGTSKGSELALLSAVLFSDISCVVVRVPSYFVSEGLTANGKSKKPSGTSCWSYKGKELPYSAYNKRDFNVPKIILREKEMNILTINKDKTISDDSIIPVEKINAPILILSAANDTVWPSYESGKYIENRLNQNDFQYPHKHIVFPTLSHVLLTKINIIFKLAFKTERRNKAKCAEERVQLASELLTWVNDVWK